MTIQELFQEAQYTFAQQPDNERFVSDFYSAVNRAHEYFVNYRGGLWGCLRTTGSLSTTASQRYVTLASNFNVLSRMKGGVRVTTPTASEGNEILVIDMSEFYTKEYDNDDTDEPVYCWAQGNYIYFSPIPDATYTVTYVYYKKFAEIGTADDDLNFPSQYNELLQTLVFRRLQVKGYVPIQEISISDADILDLIGRAVRDDVQKYGGPKFNLSPSNYRRQTV